MNRSTRTWLSFGVCLAAAVAAVGWLSHSAWQSDQQRQRALVDNQIRNALWRLDSLAAPLLAVEANRASYTSSPDRAPALSPLLVKAHLRRRADGAWMMRRPGMPEMRVAAPEIPFAAIDWSSRLGSQDQQSLPGATAPEIRSDAETDVASLILWPTDLEPPLMSQVRRDRTDIETQSRNQLAQQVAQLANSSAMPVMGESPAPVGTPMRPLWAEGELVLVRHRRLADGTTSGQEICWLNWPQWKALLMEQVRETGLPLELVPCYDEPDVGSHQTPGTVMKSPEFDHWQMVTLPVRLQSVGPLASSDWPWPLIAVWFLLANVAVAFGVLLAETLSLSERRAAFVSAVTHELRTPLTTFRLYTEMLSDGIATDPEQRQSYYETLNAEANRLTHLVENVLAFARLERGRSSSRNETVSVGMLWDRSEPRLRQRVATTRLVWTVDLSEEVRLVTLTTNTVAVEQILFNLVDNACKYARDAADPRLVCRLVMDRQMLLISVRDFGPGLSGAARTTLFQPFQKSATQAAESAPGVGLGLALSWRLARDLGGSLQVNSAEGPGLCASLRLPIDPTDTAPSNPANPLS